MAGKGIQPSARGRRKPSGMGSKAPGPTAGRGQGQAPRQQVIPDAVASRMARRIAIATGIPTLMGMGVFIASYLLVTRGVAEIPPGATLVASGACFLLGLLGLSYGVLSASWDPQPGSWLGAEQIGVNLGRLRQSIGALRQRRAD